MRDDFKRLLAGLAHEMNTPLGALKSNNEVIDQAFRKIEQWIEKFPEAAELKETFSIIETSIRTNRLAGDRLVALVHNVRRFGRIEDNELKMADIHDSIETALAILAHDLKYRISVVKEFGEVPRFACYPGQLSQILLNVLQNAAQSIDGAGEIRIKTWQKDSAVYIAISDTGRGIPAEIQSRIFDPGFTTKEEHGEGLGLAICFRFIQNHGGRIDVESQVGRGSTFTIVLPISERKGNE